MREDRSDDRKQTINFGWPKQSILSPNTGNDN